MKWFAKKTVLTTAFCAGGLTILFFISPLFVSQERFFTRLEAETFALTGEKLSIKGSKSFTLTPFPTLSAHDITLGEGLKAKTLRVKLGPFWMVSEALTSNNLTLIDGEAINISRNRNWLARLETLARAENSPLFGALKLENFKYNFEDEQRVRILNAQLNWPNINAPLKFEGTTDEAQQFSLTITQPYAFLNKKLSALNADFSSEHGKISFAGEITREKLSGFVSFNTTHFSGEAKLIGKKGSITLDNLSLTTQGNKVEGAITLTHEGETRFITGTVSSKKWETIFPLTQEGIQDTIPNKFPPLLKPDTKFDIRFSIDELVTPTFTVRNIGAFLQGTRQDLQFDIIRATVFEGQVTGKGRISTHEIGFIGQGKDLELKYINNPFKLTGKADAEFTFISPRFSTTEAKGTVHLKSDNASFQGLNFEDVLNNFASRPLARGNFLRGHGKTTFNNFEVQASFDKGTYNFSQIALDTGKVAITGHGSLMLPSKHIDMEVLAQLKQDIVFTLPLRIEGILDAPSLRLNPQSLISRSKATEPLREGARDTEAAKRVLEAIGRQVPELAPLGK